MPRDPSVFLDDILKAIERIEDYTDNLAPDALDDPKTLDAVVRNLEVIGEAAKCIPEELRSKADDVEWRKVSGLRDILIHQYFGIDSEILKDIVTTKLIPLKQAITTLRGE